MGWKKNIVREPKVKRTLQCTVIEGVINAEIVTFVTRAKGEKKTISPRTATRILKLAKSPYIYRHDVVV